VYFQFDSQDTKTSNMLLQVNCFLLSRMQVTENWPSSEVSGVILIGSSVISSTHDCNTKTSYWTIPMA